jgi:hypothetical protein
MVTFHIPLAKYEKLLFIFKSEYITVKGNNPAYANGHTELANYSTRSLNFICQTIFDNPRIVFAVE